jgi:hypothetical protein
MIGSGIADGIGDDDSSGIRGDIVAIRVSSLSSASAASSAPSPRSLSLPTTSSASRSSSPSSISSSSPLTASSACTITADWLCSSSGSKSGLSRRSAVDGGEASPPVSALPALQALRFSVDYIGAVCFDASLRFFEGRRASGLTPCSNG